ncbi:MinD-like ATPase involved in chromosome partitioning or flagellar assembly [Marinobacter daqiaonensis]|uniref:MinD-like ATPase involved in chromosome partitioning or flagellar assembly n=1 Tax=Marinobacter daqiaonensis TaxID=650891 RepID=A0A1I6J8N4_9GAMM|nr:AAA family ATPase [Marinobacter daqiaonensis]SFR75347.1 MinD-like ATPase involved in chromosome partitioning or flagellar assembly [Marinobacter daqiaonensis]
MQVKEFQDHAAGSRLQDELPDIVAFTGGKGGVGKTSVCVNVALTMARRGRRVLLLDADTDLANVSIVLGQYPSRTLEQAVTGECQFRDVIMEAPYGLHVIPGASGVERCMDLDPDDARAILLELAAIERSYDLIIIDTASGLQSTALHMIALAALACVVITPDPASLTDAFSLLRVLQRRGYRRSPGVVVNMAAGSSQAQAVYRRFSGAVRRHLDMETSYVGAIWRDESIRQSVELQRPVAMLAESDPSCRQFMTLAEQLSLQLSRLPRRKAGLAAYWQHRKRRGQVSGADDHRSGAEHALSPGVSGQGEAGKPEVALSAPAESDDRPLASCRALFLELGRLLDRHPDDHLLHKEALNGASALLSSMAMVMGPPETDSKSGYDEADFGPQQDLLTRLKSQPDTIRVDGFLTAYQRNYE